MHHPWLRFRHLVFFMSLQLSFFCGQAQAQTPTSATSAGTAGAGRASVEATDVHSLNPAILVHLTGRDLHTAIQPNGYIVGISDNSQEIMIPAAISYYAQKKSVKDVDNVFSDLRLSLAGFVFEKFSMGVNAHQLETKVGQTLYRQNNADFGFSWAAFPTLGFASVFYNTLKSSQDLPEDVRLSPSTGLGVNYIYKEFLRLRVDVLSNAGNDFGRRSLLVGYESYLNRYTLFRLGWGDEKALDRQFTSIGFGFELPRFRMNYAYQSGLKGDFESRHSVDLGIPF